MNRPRSPKWLQALLRHLEEAPPEPGVSHIEIRHDEDCPRLLGTGPCDCDPEVVTGPIVDRKYGEDDE